MRIKLLTLFLTILYVTFAQEECQIDGVSNLQISSENDILSWTPPEPVSNDTSCQIDHYLIFINQNEENLIFTSNTNELNITELARCTTYTFTVAAVSGIYEGTPISIQGKTSAGKGESYNVAFADISQVDQNIQISWALSDGLIGCLSHFRLSYWEDGSGSPQDIEIDGMNYVLTNPVPCMVYNFEVRGILDTLVEGPATSMSFTTQGEVPEVPVLYAANELSTSIDLSWNLTSIKETRCQLVSLTVTSHPSWYFVYTDGLNENSLYSTSYEGLDPDTAYVTEVYLTNTFGNSNPLHVVLQTTSSVNDN